MLRPGIVPVRAITEVVMAHSRSTAAALPLSDRIIAGVFSLFLGAALIFAAGLANSSTLHDTAHDVRHSFGFPCH